MAGLRAGASLWGLVLRDDLVTYRFNQESHTDPAAPRRVRDAAAVGAQCQTAAR